MAEITFLNRLPELQPVDTSIYLLKAPGVNEPSLREIARRFDLKGDLKSGEYFKDSEELTYTEGPFVVTLYRSSGTLRYYDRTRWQVDDRISNVEFSDDEAVEMAKRFISQSELIPLAECELSKVSHLRVGTMELDSDFAEERVIDVGVIFKRTVDGLPVHGSGGKVTVYIDHNGDVTGFERIWRDISEVYREVPFEQLRPPEYAERSLNRYLRWKKRGRTEVEAVHFGYFELGKGELQRYLQPAYIMSFRLIGPEIGPDRRMITKSIHVVPAASKPVGRIIRQRRRAVPPESPRRR